jgi:hypothetical protein
MRKKIIELKLKLNRAKYNGNASSVGTMCASKNLENSKYLLNTDKFSNSNERVQRWVSETEPEGRQAAFARREAAYDVPPTGREAAYDITPRRREATYDVTSRGREVAYEIIRGRREAAPEDTQASFGERDAAFERRDAAFKRKLLDVDQRKIVSQYQPDKEMDDQCLQGAGKNLAKEIASSQMEEANIVLAHPNKFSSLLNLIRSAAWMYRFIKKTQKLTLNVSELTAEEMEWAKIRWYTYEQGQNCNTEIHDFTWKLQFKQTRKLIGLNPFLDDECVLRIGGRLKNGDLPDDTHGDDGVVDMQTSYGVSKLARTNIENCVDSGNQHRGENEATQVNIMKYFNKVAGKKTNQKTTGKTKLLI